MRSIVRPRFNVESLLRDRNMDAGLRAFLHADEQRYSAAPVGKSYNIAIVGATGAVGLELLDVLERRAFPVGSCGLLASARSAGKKLQFRGEEIAVEELREDSFGGIDIAFFSAGGDTSRTVRAARRQSSRRGRDR